MSGLQRRKQAKQACSIDSAQPSIPERDRGGGSIRLVTPVLIVVKQSTDAAANHSTSPVIGFAVGDIINHRPGRPPRHAIDERRRAHPPW
jgi:hypothetical protein